MQVKYVSVLYSVCKAVYSYNNTVYFVHVLINVNYLIFMILQMQFLLTRICRPTFS